MSEHENKHCTEFGGLKVDKNEVKSSVVHLELSKSRRLRSAQLDIEIDAEYTFIEMTKAADLFRQTFKDKNRIRMSHRAISGWLHDRENCRIHHESLLERDFCFLTLFHHGVQKVHEQPLTITGHDSTGQLRNYTPDFLVEFKETSGDLKKCLVEVKYISDLENAETGLLERLDLGRNWCRANGYMFEILTEREIRGIALSNVAALLPFRFYESDLAVQFELQIKVESCPGITINDLIEQLITPSLTKDLILREIWITIACGLLHFDLATSLSPNTPVYRYPVWNDGSLFFCT